ncbi:hypothetical protein CCACVL1_01917 [Corchorus capsularis]|uniref:Uncharacterized protein n=1 Tax=Corchorus capsularis TaxID=210143 RepID=A0A1R3KE87_COCAP|nr:hypothetical protein CCACVL1_01917 [Corchorus capsularis]
MSCLSIRLPPAKKAWKSFTSKLQTRLHKLHKSKAIKKPNTNHRLQTAVAKTTRPSLFLGQRLQRNYRRRRSLPFGYQRRYFVSKSKTTAVAPVYIDKLFKDVPVTELVGYIHQQEDQKEKNVKPIDQAAAASTAGDAEAGTSMEGDEKQRDDVSPMASPAMLQGIDARAEEFIASFRAEMERQEILARKLL